MALVDLTGFTKRYLEHDFRPTAFTRGFVSQLNGRSSFAAAAGGSWAATFTLPVMCAMRGRQFRALIGMADGRAGTVLINADNRLPLQLINGRLTTRKTRFTDGTQFSDVTTFTDNLASFAGAVTVSAAASRDAQVTQITITLPVDITASELPGMIVGIGDPFGPAGAYQAIEVSRVVSQAGQDVTIEIRPRLRRAIAAGDQVFIGSPPLRMKFIDDDPAGGLNFRERGSLSSSTFDMIEAD
jgi:hypothetical protein